MAFQIIKSPALHIIPVGNVAQFVTRIFLPVQLWIWAVSRHCVRVILPAVVVNFI